MLVHHNVSMEHASLHSFLRSNQIPLERPGHRGDRAADAGAGDGCFSRAGP